jgi:hypothetical protein
MRSVLIGCFLSHVEEALRFLEVKHGFGSFSGTLDYALGRQIIKPYRPVLVGTSPRASGPSAALPTRTPSSDTFCPDAATIYEKDNTALEIRFSPAEGRIHIHVCFGRIHRLRFADLIQAARRGPLTHAESYRAEDEETLILAIEEAARMLHAHHDLITMPDTDLIERAIRMRDKIMEEKIRAQFRRDLEEAQQQAARAFVYKDYVRVIMLLSPYMHYLDAASARIMEQARRYVRGS